jgi:hypothetical protein
MSTSHETKLPKFIDIEDPVIMKDIYEMIPKKLTICAPELKLLLTVGGRATETRVKEALFDSEKAKGEYEKKLRLLNAAFAELTAARISVLEKELALKMVVDEAAKQEKDLAEERLKKRVDILEERNEKAIRSLRKSLAKAEAAKEKLKNDQY